MRKQLLIQRTLIVMITLIFFLIVSMKIFSQNAVSTLCGTSIQGNPLAGPNGICISPNGTTLYLCDYSAQKIKKVATSNGAVSNYAGTGTPGYMDGAVANAKFSYPSGIKISSDGISLYVADNGNCLIRKINLSTNMVSTIAGVSNAFAYADSSDGMQAQFNQPVDLVISGDTVLYVSDSENHLIRKVNLVTSAVTTLAGSPGSFGANDGIGSNAKFHNPNGLALSSDGHTLYVADGGNHLIRKIDIPSKDVTTLAGTGVSGYLDSPTGILSMFNTPQGVVLLPNDNLLYVMDTYNNRIRIIDVNTTAVSTVAGTNSISSNHFGDNSNGLLAKFWHPVNGVVTTNGAKLYISDQENFRVRNMNTDLSITGIISPNVLNSVTVFPNPANDLAQIIITADKETEATYSLWNMNGKKIFSSIETRLFEGTQMLPIPVKGLVSGVYFIRLDTPASTQNIKLIVTN